LIHVREQPQPNKQGLIQNKLFRGNAQSHVNSLELRHDDERLTRVPAQKPSPVRTFVGRRKGRRFQVQVSHRLHGQEHCKHLFRYRAETTTHVRMTWPFRSAEMRTVRYEQILLRQLLALYRSCGIDSYLTISLGTSVHVNICLLSFSHSSIMNATSVTLCHLS
jgi:hypothetical protein